MHTEKVGAMKTFSEYNQNILTNLILSQLPLNVCESQNNLEYFKERGKINIVFLVV